MMTRSSLTARIAQAASGEELDQAARSVWALRGDNDLTDDEARELITAILARRDDLTAEQPQSRPSDAGSSPTPQTTLPAGGATAGKLNQPTVPSKAVTRVDIATPHTHSTQPFQRLIVWIFSVNPRLYLSPSLLLRRLTERVMDFVDFREKLFFSKLVGQFVRVDLGEGFKPVPCRIENVSQGDAMITVPPTDTIPDEFYLRFSLTGVTRRRCVVKSRLPGSIRVQFIKQK